VGVLDKIIKRIEEELHCHHIVENLVEKCSLPDLTSLLLAVYQEKTKKIPPRAVLQQYLHNGYVQPAHANVLEAMRFDLLAQSLLPHGFEMVELSPLAPLGSNSVIAPVNQNNVLSTIRNVEVCSDPTTVLALESAARKHRLHGEKKRPLVKLACSHRVVRGQKFKDPNCFPHFRILALTTAGQDWGSFAFEVEALYEHISYFCELLLQSKSIGIKVRDLAVHITALDETRQPVLQKTVLDRLVAKHSSVNVRFDQDRTSGRGYYRDVCYHIFAKDASGEEMLLVDGGCTDWTQQLLGNKKERFLISGLGSERLLVCT
jgi:hypothetical protein